MSGKIAKKMTPAQHIKSHYVTRELKRLGVTNKQLKSMRFTGKNRNDPFERWPFWSEGPADGPFPLVKAYCALKWLLLEDPPYSRDRDDAWRLVSETMATPTLAIGERTRIAQNERSRKPRGKFPYQKQTLGGIVKELALKPQHQHETAKQLWPRLFSALMDLDLDPKEVIDPKDPGESAYEYDFGEKTKTMGFRRFANVVSTARRKKKSL